MKKLKMILTNTIIIFLYSINIYAGTISDIADDSRYVEYGKNINCVVQMIGKTQEKITSQFSGVIIHPNWIITSAHTLDSDKKFYFIDAEQNHVSIDEYYIHPEFNPEIFGSIDIGLCYIKKIIKIDFIPELYSDTDEVNRLCCIVGYGMTGTGSTGAIVWDGKKRAGSNFIDHINNKLLICNMSRNGEKNTELEICIAPGDSGGGLFIDKKLAGINSCVIHKEKRLKAKYGDESGHVRISNKKCLDWINYIIYE